MILRLSLSLLFLFLFSATQSQAQRKPEVFIGPVLDDQKGISTLEVFGMDDSAFFTLQKSRKKREGYSIVKLDADSLRVITKHNFKLPEVNGVIPALQDVITMEGHSYLIATTEDPRMGAVLIHAFEVLSNAQVVQTPIRLGSASAEALNHGGNFRTYVDRDKSHLTVVVPTEHLEGRNEKFELSLYDTELNLKGRKKLEVPYASERLDYIDATSDGSGDVFVLASIKNTSLEGMDKDRNIGKDFSLLHYSWETESLTEKSLSLGLKWLYDVRLLVNKHGHLQICGYYSNMVDLVMAGTFSVEIEPNTGEVLHQGISPFDRKFRGELRPASHNTSDVDAYELDYTFNSDSSNAILISEKKYTETTQSFNPATGSYSTIYVYNFDEILISSIDESSAINFNVVIPKFQSSSSRNNTYTSFLAESHAGSVYLFYNDHERNAELDIDEDRKYRQLTSATNGQLVMVQIEPNGRTHKTPLFTATSMRASFIPDFSYKTSNGIILMAKSGYRSQYFKIILD